MADTLLLRVYLPGGWPLRPLGTDAGVVEVYIDRHEVELNSDLRLRQLLEARMKQAIPDKVITVDAGSFVDITTTSTTTPFDVDPNSIAAKGPAKKKTGEKVRGGPNILKSIPLPDGWTRIGGATPERAEPGKVSISQIAMIAHTAVVGLAATARGPISGHVMANRHWPSMDDVSQRALIEAVKHILEHPKMSGRDYYEGWLAVDKDDDEADAEPIIPYDNVDNLQCHKYFVFYATVIALDAANKSGVQDGKKNTGGG